MKRIYTLISTSALALALGGPVLAETSPESSAATPANAEKTAEEQKNARETVAEAAQVLEQMRKQDSAGLLSKAKAVFIVPDYGRASLGIGGAGGQGVLVVNNGGQWTGPAFYNIGSVNIGLEAGVEAGSIAFLMMTDKGIQGFEDGHNFSLNADAGLTIIDWSKRGQLSAGKGADVIAWADTEGLYGNIAVNVTDIFWDDEANRSYYQKKVAANDIFSGSVQDPSPSSPLKSEFSAMEAGSISK